MGLPLEIGGWGGVIIDYTHDVLDLPCKGAQVGTYNCAYKFSKIGENGLATLRVVRGHLLSQDQGMPWQQGEEQHVHLVSWVVHGQSY
jgi:hypothetical protein